MENTAQVQAENDGEKSGNNCMGYDFNYKKYYSQKNLFVCASICLARKRFLQDWMNFTGTPHSCANWW